MKQEPREPGELVGGGPGEAHHHVPVDGDGAGQHQALPRGHVAARGLVNVGRRDVTANVTKLNKTDTADVLGRQRGDSRGQREREFSSPA